MRVANPATNQPSAIILHLSVLHAPDVSHRGNGVIARTYRCVPGADIRGCVGPCRLKGDGRTVLAGTAGVPRDVVKETVCVARHGIVSAGHADADKSKRGKGWAFARIG